MLGKTSKPVMEIFTGSIVSGNPRNQTESKIQSPRGLKSLDLGGVGLGIVAALHKSGDGGGIPALFGRNLTRSSPIPVKSPKNSWRYRREAEEPEMDSSEEYTIVTCHGAAESHTTVYSGGGGRNRAPFRIQSGKKSSRAAVFDISPARYTEAAGAPAPDFLSLCDLCRKKLHGKDIYMYKGEKAFCSSECRYTQMVIDERKEKCGGEAAAATAAAEVAGSPYGSGKIFTTGIFAI